MRGAIDGHETYHRIWPHLGLVVIRHEPVWG